MRGFCIFCGGGPTTAEHWLAEWIHEKLGDSNAELWRPKVRAGSVKWRSAGRDSRGKVKSACANCNNGWMSDLEGAVKPLLAAMMQDFLITLDRESQRFLAAWCAKTAMVLESVSRDGPWFYRPSERKHLRTVLALPDITAVWLGRYQRSDLSLSEARNLYRGAIPEDDSRRGEGYVTTFTIGRVVPQIATLRVTNYKVGTRLTLEVKPGPWNESLVQIWPADRAAVTWPPSASFDQAGLDALAGRCATSLTRGSEG
jgi:hypothetical protein